MTERADLKSLLVTTALAILETGAGELSLRAVARAAGVSAMAPYRHFAGKAALLAAVAECGFMALRERLVAADAQTDPHAALLEQGLAYVAFARARPALFRLMFSSQSWEPASPAENADAYAVLARRVADLVPGDAEGAALACWSIVHGLATLALDGPLAGLEPERERRALALFVNALRQAVIPPRPSGDGRTGAACPA
jgi:AcrR family transcriptional regulator